MAKQGLAISVRLPAAFLALVIGFFMLATKKAVKDVTGKNATQDAVMIAVLKSNKGAQEYVLPSNIDINDYESLLIHCEAYSVLWGGANFAHGAS